ncbi:Putative cell wall binding repeat-containing protein, partial [Ruminococcaceae bacterium YRB3002]
MRRELKVISSVLAAVIVMSSLMVNLVSASQIIYSGDNWTYDSDGTFEITVNKDYSYQLHFDYEISAFPKDVIDNAKTIIVNLMGTHYGGVYVEGPYADETKVETITINAPNSPDVEDIIVNSFSSLKKINYPDKEMVRLCVRDTGLTSLSIPAGVEAVELYRNSKLSSVNLPSGLTSLCATECAFTSLSLPNSVESLDVQEMPGLTSINIPSKINRAYLYDLGVSELSFPSGTQLISLHKLPNVNSLSVPSTVSGLIVEEVGLTSLSIPDSVHDITLIDMPGLTSIKFPQNATYIYACNVGINGFTFLPIQISNGYAALSDMPKLKTVTYASGCTTTRAWSLYDCNKVSKINLPATLTSIEYSSFKGLTSLKSISLPSSLKSIGDSAFVGCGLESVEIPSGITEIQYTTFYGNQNLKEITVPATLTRIDASAFENCTALTDVYYEGTKAQWDQISTESIIPDHYDHTWDYHIDKDFPMDTVINNATVHYAAELYPIAIVSGEGGTLAASAETSAYGKTITLYPVADDGYVLDTLKAVDAAGNEIAVVNDQFTMPESAVTATATYKLADYNITIGNSQGGIVTADKATAHMGDIVTLDATPNDNYEFTAYLVKDADGVRVDVINGQFTMPASNVTVTGLFCQTKFEVSVTYDSSKVTVNGIESTTDSVPGTVYDFTLTPKSGYKVTSVKVNGDAIQPASDTHYYVTQEEVDLDIVITVTAINNGQNGWIKDGSDYYYYKNGKMVTGWLQVGSPWYYMDPETGIMVTGWREIGGKWYYFASSGAMKTGWISDGGKYYYCASSGAMQTGWVKSGKSWYYMDPEQSGVMVTGLKQIGSDMYLFSGSGAMQTGWKSVGGSWFYFNSSGAAAKGWKQVGKTWYYFDPSTCVMTTGLIEIGGKLYGFKSSGAMATGWASFDGDYYYFAGSGAAYINKWVKSSGKWYYLGADGKMYHSGTLNIGGVDYTFNGSGA